MYFRYVSPEDYAFVVNLRYEVAAWRPRVRNHMQAQAKSRPSSLKYDPCL